MAERSVGQNTIFLRYFYHWYLHPLRLEGQTVFDRITFFQASDSGLQLSFNLGLNNKQYAKKVFGNAYEGGQLNCYVYI